MHCTHSRKLNSQKAKKDKNIFEEWHFKGNFMWILNERKTSLREKKNQIKDDEKRIKFKAAYVTLIERFEWKSWWIENSICFISELHSKRNESRALKCDKMMDKSTINDPLAMKLIDI